MYWVAYNNDIVIKGETEVGSETVSGLTLEGFNTELKRDTRYNELKT